MKRLSIPLLTAVFLGLSAPANAAIIGAVGATIDVGGPGFGSISDTFDQSGLRANYVSGVTDFDTFVANTKHDWVFAGNEWFSNLNTTSARVTYDLGSIRTIDKMALWNDEAAGMGKLDLLVSNDGVTFSNLLLGLVPTDNFAQADYAADVFGFGATSFRYISMAMSECPQVLRDEGPAFPSCAIGEVAFNEVGVIPVPASLPLIFSGLLLLGGVRRLRRKS